MVGMVLDLLTTKDYTKHNLCTVHDLDIAYTVFQLPNKLKTTWIHPQFKHWHLIDYAIVRRRDLHYGTITRALQGDERWINHHLVRSILHFRIQRSIIKCAKAPLPHLHHCHLVLLTTDISLTNRAFPFTSSPE